MLSQVACLLGMPHLGVGPRVSVDPGPVIHGPDSLVRVSNHGDNATPAKLLYRTVTLVARRESTWHSTVKGTQG